MGLFDRLKDKAGELVDQATDAASGATGIDIKKGLEVADQAVEGAEQISDAVDTLSEVRDRLKGSDS